MIPFQAIPDMPKSDISMMMISTYSTTLPQMFSKIMKWS